MNNLEKQYLIRRGNLNQAHYFQSFLKEASRLNLLSDSELQDLEIQSLKLLAKQTERYNFGDSSSVKIETAQGILKSIFYTIGIYLKSFQNTDVSLRELKETPLQKLYQNGRNLISIKFKNSRQMLNSIQNSCLITENIAYNDTIKTGITVFFSKYDADFAAQDVPGAIDYPLSNDMMDLCGIEYIYNYLNKLNLENDFCKNFSKLNITNLLQGYNEHYKDLLINIFELVLTNALGLLILNKNILKLNITPSDSKKLELRLENLSKDQIYVILHDTFLLLISQLNISNQLLQNYISESLTNISVRIKTALDNHALESVFINSKVYNKGNELIFDEGQNMDDELFRKITEEIRDCRFASDKAAIIRREIHSASDLADIFEADCIFKEEFYVIFKTLSQIELALLTKKLPSHVIASDFHFSECEKEWQSRLICFLDEIGPGKKEKIKALADKINLE